MQLIAKPYIKDKNLTKAEEKALPNYLHPETCKSRAERRGRIKFLPTGVQDTLQCWRKTSTGSWTRN